MKVFSDLNDSGFKARSLEALQSPVLEGDGAEICWLRARTGAEFHLRRGAGAGGAPGAGCRSGSAGARRDKPLGLQRESRGGRTAGAVLLRLA